MNRNMNRAIWPYIVVLAGLALGAGSPVLAAPTSDPAIAYTTSDSRSNYLMVMNADGTNQRALLTAPKRSNVNFGGPNWSPDGTQIVFASNVQGSGLYVIKNDGTGLGAIQKIKQRRDEFVFDKKRRVTHFNRELKICRQKAEKSFELWQITGRKVRGELQEAHAEPVFKFHDLRHELICYGLGETQAFTV